MTRRERQVHSLRAHLLFWCCVFISIVHEPSSAQQLSESVPAPDIQGGVPTSDPTQGCVPLLCRGEVPTSIRASLEYVSCSDGDYSTSSSCTAACSPGKKVVSGSCTAQISAAPSRLGWTPYPVRISRPAVDGTGWYCQGDSPASNTAIQVAGNAVCL